MTALLPTTPEEEWRAIQVAAARGGCTVISLEVRDTGHGRHVVGEVVCPDGWAAARMLLAEAIEFSKTAGARDLALQIRRGAPTDAEYAAAVQEFVKQRVKFVREAGEVFAGPGYTLQAGAGDCDDQALLAMTLGLAGGLDARLGLLHHGDDAPPEEQGPAHAAPLLCYSGNCQWIETTVDAGFGEHPLAAAARLGLLSARNDIAREVVVMSEKDLVPVPADFRIKNPPAQVALDSDALVRLGYLAALPEDPANPEDMNFRAALLAMQIAAGIPADGLIGPISRSTIAGRLPPGDPFTEDYKRSIGAIGVATSLSAHLSDKFLHDVADLARKFQAGGARVTGLDFLAVMLGESGIHASAGIAKLERGGLNGMGPVERKAVGFQGTYADWIALSAEDQFPFVARFFLQDASGHFSSIVDGPALYMLNFVPAFISHANDPGFVITRKGDASGFYENNPGLDLVDGAPCDGRSGVGTKGYIEVADMRRWFEKNIRCNPAYWNELVGRMAVIGDAPTPGLSVATVGTLGVLALAFGAAVLNGIGKL